jgi:hypothetical protein
VLVDERLVRGQDIVTIGQSVKNTFPLPVEGAPRAWPLFRRVRDQYLLSFSHDMDGRLSTADGVRTFAELRDGRIASEAGGGWTIPIGNGTRGKLRVGGATVLFQLLEVPVQPRPMLPKSIRGTLADRLNPMLMAIVAVSLVAHGAFAYWLYQRDVDSRTTLERIGEADPNSPRADDMYAIVVPADVIDLLEPVAKPAPGVDVDVRSDPATPRGDRRRSDRPRGDSASRRDLDDARIRELVDGTAAIAVLTGGPDKESRYGNMASKDPGGDLDRSIKHVANSGQPIVTQRPDGLLIRDGGDRDIARSDAPDVEGPDGTDLVVDKHERKLPPPKLEDVEPLDPDGVDPAEIAKIIKRRYIKGVNRCHLDLLRIDARAGGRVDVEFTVSKVGKVVRARADGFDSGLDQCVQTLAKRWRFPVAKADGKPVEASYATTFMFKAP